MVFLRKLSDTSRSLVIVNPGTLASAAWRRVSSSKLLTFLTEAPLADEARDSISADTKDQLSHHSLLRLGKGSSFPSASSAKSMGPKACEAKLQLAALRAPHAGTAGPGGEGHFTFFDQVRVTSPWIGYSLGL